MQLLYDLIYAVWPFAAVFVLWAGWHFTVDEDMERPASSIKGKK